jgi:hypothetical protein
MLTTIREEKVQQLLNEVFSKNEILDDIKRFGSLSYAITSVHTCPLQSLNSGTFNQLVKVSI